MAHLSSYDWMQGFGEGLDLVVLVLSKDDAVMARVLADAPAALRVERVLDPDSARDALLEPTLLTALVCDAAFPPAQRARVVHAVEEKWPYPRTAVVCRRSSEAARLDLERVSVVVDLSAPHPREGALDGFLRDAVDSCLRWVARYLRFALDRGLEGPLLALYVATVIRQVARPGLAAYLGIGETTVKRRITAMLAELRLGEGGLPRLHHHLNNIASTNISPWHLTELERGAEAQRAKRRGARALTG